MVSCGLRPKGVTDGTRPEQETKGRVSTLQQEGAGGEEVCVEQMCGTPEQIYTIEK